jgi:hypothetical protein
MAAKDAYKGHQARWMSYLSNLRSRRMGHKMGGTMLVRLEAGTAEPRVINLAEVPI